MSADVDEPPRKLTRWERFVQAFASAAVAFVQAQERA